MHAILGQWDAIYFYGISGVELCKAEGFEDFNLAFAYESIAAAENIAKEQEKKYFSNKLVSVNKG